MHSETLRIDAVTWRGSGLNRPECVLTNSAGALYASDAQRGIVQILPDGGVQPVLHASFARQGLLPNGFALCADGSFLLANLGEAGGFWRAFRDRPAEPLVTEIDGKPIPPANFIWPEANGRIWLTVSAATRHHEYFTSQAHEGYVALIENGQARIVADHMNWTNELRVSPDGRHLFVNETFSCRVARFDIGPRGDLSNRVNIEFPPGTFPDGLAHDAEGGLWVICVATNRLIRIAPDLSWEILLEDYDPAHFARIQAAFGEHRLTRELLVGAVGGTLVNVSSLAFGGADLRTIYLGSLTGKRIAVLRSPVAGMKPLHWHWN